MPRSLLTFFISTTLFTHSSLWAETDEDENESSLPAMRVLPVGSSLHEVRIPRFDKDYNTTSTFHAKRVDILKKNHLRGTHVAISLYKNGNPQLSTHLDSASYYTDTEVIHSLKSVELSGEVFDIAAQGIVLDWQKQAGFLLGKTQTLFYPDKDSETSAKEVPTKSMPSTTSVKIAQKTKAATAALATVPMILSADEIKEIDRLAQSSAPIVEQAHTDAEKEISNIQNTSAQITRQKQEVREELVLAVNNQVQPESEPDPLIAPKGKVPVSIACEDGMFFNADTGVVIYQKDVVITHPKYKLTCADELKVILKQEEVDEAQEKQKEEDLIAPDPTQLSRFKGLDKAIATGNVVMEAKDKDGKLITTRSNIAIYNANDGTIILKGGRPTIQHGDTIGRILSDSGYIKIDAKMNAVFKGPHEFNANLKELQKENSQQ